MKLDEYVQDRAIPLLLHLVAGTALAVFLYATGTSTGVITLIVLVWALGLSLITSVSYVKSRNEILELEAILEQLPQKYLLMECAPTPKSYYKRHLFRILRRAGKSMMEEKSDIETRWNEYREYIENWVHEIKVPVTAAMLVCENNKSDVSRKIRSQLALIDSHVERALYYARLDALATDLLLRDVSLEEVVTKELSKLRFLMTQHNMRVDIAGLTLSVCTDSKWVGFMIGQILSNSIKYTGPNATIRIYAEQTADRIRLSIEDNGIGIPASELKRIFDKGFTGTNGRTLGGSTGMGLYICKKLAFELGARMEAESRQKEYTRISIVFPILSKT